VDDQRFAAGFGAAAAALPAAAVGPGARETQVGAILLEHTLADALHLEQVLRRANGPFFCRYSTIASAFAGPMPSSSFASVEASAVFTFTGAGPRPDRQQRGDEGLDERAMVLLHGRLLWLPCRARDGSGRLN